MTEEERAKTIESLLKSSYKYHLERLKYDVKEHYIDINLVENAQKNIKEIHSMLGGIPSLLISFKEKEKPIYDTYIESMMNELGFSIKKSYETALKVKFYSHLESLSNIYADPKVESVFSDIYKSEFWSYLEMAYIRMASVWDRIGRLLEFVFFNIRQYDKGGYLSTIEKIHINLIPMSDQLKNSNAWKNIWNYSKKQNINGLKWLLSRRNLIVHQVSLQEKESFDVANTEFYYSEHNHFLENTVKKKLKPMEIEEEVEQFKEHVETTLKLLKDLKELCKLGIELIPKINN